MIKILKHEVRNSQQLLRITKTPQEQRSQKKGNDLCIIKIMNVLNMVYAKGHIQSDLLKFVFIVL